MIITIMTIVMATMISMSLMMICSIISKKSKSNREKMTPFEFFGFDPKKSARIPFSMQFFMIAIIFLIFDVEIIIILPTIKMIHMSKMKTWFMTKSMFMIILIIGLYQK